MAMSPGTSLENFQCTKELDQKIPKGSAEESPHMDVVVENIFRVGQVVEVSEYRRPSASRRLGAKVAGGTARIIACNASVSPITYDLNFYLESRKALSIPTAYISLSTHDSGDVDANGGCGGVPTNERKSRRSRERKQAVRWRPEDEEELPQRQRNERTKKPKAVAAVVETAANIDARNTKAFKHGTWRTMAFPERRYERISSYELARNLDCEDSKSSGIEGALSTSLGDNRVLGMPYNDEELVEAYIGEKIMEFRWNDGA